MNEELEVIEKLKILNRKKDSDTKRANAIFNVELEFTSVVAAIGWWKGELEKMDGIRLTNIGRDYLNLKELISWGVIEEVWNVVDFNLYHPKILKRLMEVEEWEIEEKSEKVFSLIAFTSFLHEKSAGAFRRLQAPADLQLQNTVKSSPKVLSCDQWRSFRDELKKISERDSLIAEMMACTARGMNEILSLELGALNLTTDPQITFSDEEGAKSAVSLNDGMVKKLQAYIVESQTCRVKSCPYVFLTKNGKAVYRTHIRKVFEKASLNASLNFKVTSSMVQWTVVAEWLRSMNLSKKQIMEKMKLKYIPRKLEI